MDSDEEMGGVLQDDLTVLESSEMNGRLRNVDPSGRAPVGLATAIDNTEMLDGSESPPRVSNLSIPKPAKDATTDTDDSSSLEDSVDSRPLPSQFVGVVIPKPITQALPYSSHRSGLVYDARMRFHTEKDLEEDEEIHPEDPRRIYEIFKELENAGLLENENREDDQRVTPYKLWRIPTRFAEQAEVCLVHSTELWEWMNTLDSKLSLTIRN
jgi:histone deacetylase 6